MNTYRMVFRLQFLFFFLLYHSLLLELAVSASISGSGVDVGGFGVWIGRGGNGGYGGNGGNGGGDTSLSTSYKALQAWKSSITEDPKGILKNWVGPNVCSYTGVFCSDPPEDSTIPTTVVSVIDLNRANMKGTLVDDLSLLTHLSALHLNTNRFYGSVPNSFSNFVYLTELDLSNNNFAGPFPTTVLSIQNLAYLDLRFNGFVGVIPDEVFDKDLDAIFLHNNMFDGEIPSSLWNSPASVVSFANNRFTGNLKLSSSPSSSGLREVLFLNNKLTGCIPEEIGYLTEMEVLDLSFNSFTGQLPTSISCLSDIEVFNIAHNQISGVVPDVVCSLTNLLNLTISFNFFSGYSQDCTAKSFLRFDFSGNCINGGGELQRPEPECDDVPGGGSYCTSSPSSIGLSSCRKPETIASTTTVAINVGGIGSLPSLPLTEQIKVPSLP